MWFQFFQNAVNTAEAFCLQMLESTIDVLGTAVHTYTASLCGDGRKITDILFFTVIIVYLGSFTRSKDRILSDCGIACIDRRIPVIFHQWFGELIV